MDLNDFYIDKYIAKLEASLREEDTEISAAFNAGIRKAITILKESKHAPQQ